MSPETDLRRRLRRLNRRPPSVAPTVIPREASAGTLDGEEIATPVGTAYRMQRSFPLDHQHGPGRLSDLLVYDSVLVSEVARQPALAQASMEGLLFLDTETTGLAGGAGTLAFLVGVGTFTAEGFRLRQYFLRDPADEAAMLHALLEDLDLASGLVTFNGQAFDLPLLESRYIIGLRQRRGLLTVPHLDLLHPSRRLWSRALPDCAMGTIEQHVLHLHRSEDDIPGALIPALYLEYLRTGAIGGMQRVIYHNTMDVLSLVGVATQVLGRHSQADPAQLTASEALAVGRWHQRAGRVDPAEHALRSAVDSSEGDLRLEALRRLTEYLKRGGRAAEALSAWAEWHDRAPADPTPCLELAKYFEWDARDVDQALYWSEEAQVALTHWPADWRRDEVAARLAHRLERLRAKRSTLSGEPRRAALA
ncbi:MAG: ribonuclease H-like domain-containing protein [Chloroflexi bacterium]|nr:ribonuclease H-like domain-containing protein [Chloroflexota bacterium]